jgi:Fe-S cluster assembly protein SufD
MTTQIAPDLYNRLADAFSNRPQENGGEALSAIRNKAFEAFRLQGFPSIGQEDWRFTNLVPFLNDPFTLSTGTAPAGFEQLVENAWIPGIDSYKLALVNGSVIASLSDLPDAEDFTIQPLREVSGTPVFTQHLQDTNYTGSALTALNTASFTDGYFIEIKANAELDKPLQIVNIYTVAENTFFQPRNLVIANKHSKAAVIERSVAAGNSGIAFINSVTETIVKDNAFFTHHYIQSTDSHTRWLHHHEVKQGRDSRYDNFTFSLPDAELIRNNLHIALDGSNTETHMYGLYLVGDGQLTDNHTAVAHLNPNCVSNELYKGVLMGNGKAVFNGKVFVEQDAQKTNAYQQNNNMLLSDKAQVYAKPQLEIFADDVKCSHGCTIGQFNPDSLFYLRARGIGEEAARNLLVEAFAFDITDKIEDETLKEYIQGLIHEKMAAAN